jgi:4'-phosphopantetheinyl transferase
MSPCPGLPEDGEVHLWLVRDYRRVELAAFSEILDGREMERYRRFYRQEDAERFAAAHVALRTVLASYPGTDPGAVEFIYDARGKPHPGNTGPAGLEFNMSHAGNVVLIAVARGREVGVDVEKLRNDFPFMDVARSFFAGREYDLLRSCPADARPTLFFTLWTRKEACIKAAGRGLHLPLDRVDLADEGIVRDCQDAVVDGVRYTIAGLRPAPGYVGAVAAPGPLKLTIYTYKTMGL